MQLQHTALFFSLVTSIWARAYPSLTLSLDDPYPGKDFTPFNPTPAALVPRATTTDAFSCDEHNPCSNSACCGKSGFCGYGPKYCGTTGKSPNDDCWSNCEAHAECGKDAAIPGTTCPLNVCCSQYGFCGTTTDFCSQGCQSGCDKPVSKARVADTQKRIVGYYESWSVSRKCMGMEIRDIPVESLTHLNYAFAYIDRLGNIGPMPKVSPKTFSDFTSLKQRNGAVILGVSLGGWSFNDNRTLTQDVFHDLAADAAKRGVFITNLVSFMNKYGFDAVDMDWEYPGAPDRQSPDVDAQVDGANYVQLLKEIRTAFDAQPRKLYISFTAPTSYWYLRWFDIKGMVEVADYVNFMTYDLHGEWDRDDPIGNQVLAHTNLTEIDLSLDLLWRNEVDPAKVNLGLAFYSRTFELKDATCTTPGCPFSGGGAKGACTKTSGILSYREVTEVLASQDIVPYYDKDAGVKYFHWGNNQWASYDDEQTFQQKISYANKLGLGGLLIWAIDQDNTNLDALRGVLYPSKLKDRNIGDDVSFWQSQAPADCETTSCGGSCSPGTIEITTLKCPSGGKNNDQKLCCPLASAPDPKTCSWRGGPSWCNGQCHGGEVALASSRDSPAGHCLDGLQFYCCPIPEVADGAGINCGWQDTCRNDQTLMTFAGTFLEDIDDFLRKAGSLVGDALADLLDQYDVKNQKRYCCGKEESSNWKECHWAGTTGKGFDSCDDNHCATGHEVELTTSFFGDGETCSPKLERQRAFCCTPASGKSLFLPVPLEDLFPHPPPNNVADPIFNLKVDDTWGTGIDHGKDDPNDASFGFVVITAPDEVQVSLDKRDGSPWELFDCFNADSEDEQTIRMICTDDSHDSRCNDIHRGHGAEGTIVDMPKGCGPGDYAVVKSMSVSTNQSLPHHLRKRNLQGSVYDLTFDYDFTRVPRAFGDALMRIDYSNEEGYWDSVVDRPGQAKHKREDMDAFRRNRKRWLEDEWRDAYHHGALTKEDLHRRWFGSDVIDWIAKLVGVGQAEITEELHHTVDERLQVVLIDQQFGPCNVGPAVAQGNLKATLDAHVQVDTSFGLTIIATLAFPPDLSQSYLYFKNRGEITASFSLDAVATLTYTTGDIKMIGLDNFPGATFRVPGIVTVGPNLEVFAAVDAFLTAAGHLQADVTVAKWEVQQTFPENAKYPAAALDDPSHDGSQAVGVPTFDATVTANGEVALHLKPEVTFGIVFDDRWKVPECSARLVLDGYVIFHAEASYSLNGDNSCPFSYGIDAGASIYAQLTSPPIFNWGGVTTVPIGTLERRQLTPETCAKNESSSLKFARSVSGGSDGLSLTTTDLDVPQPLGLGSVPLHSLFERETFTIGPLLAIPDGFLNCPTPANASTNLTICPLCQNDDGEQGSVGRRGESDGVAPGYTTCPWLGPGSDDVCTTDSSALSGIDKRITTGDAIKEIKLYWYDYDIPLSHYPPCGDGSNLGGVMKWFLPAGDRQDAPVSTCDPSLLKTQKARGGTYRGLVAGRTTNNFGTDHVFEVQILARFLDWVCGKPKNYGSGAIPWPANWGRPDKTWCGNVFGGLSTDGFMFGAVPGDRNPTNFVLNAGRYMGNRDQIKLLALYWDDGNRIKGDITIGNTLRADKLTAKDLTGKVKLAANVFQYLQDSDVSDAWTNPSNLIEQICVQFDNTFWTAVAGNNPAFPTVGTPLTRPAAPVGVTNWGLRTLWCYWIDNHLNKAEQAIGMFLGEARNELNSKTTGSATTAASFLQAYMGPGGLATVSNMHFPRRANWNSIALPGQNSALSTQSRYKMWGDLPQNTFGPLGL